jgi:predicted ATPase
VPYRRGVSRPRRRPPRADFTESEACFEQSIRIAQRQQAKSLELRGATSLARLWGDQGKRQQARLLPAPVYCWFTEGFDTPDLKEAKALLDELEGSLPSTTAWT